MRALGALLGCEYMVCPCAESGGGQVPGVGGCVVPAIVVRAGLGDP